MLVSPWDRQRAPRNGCARVLPDYSIFLAGKKKPPEGGLPYKKKSRPKAAFCANHTA
jgi:hypothetical protein